MITITAINPAAMSRPLDQQRLELAFKGRPDIIGAIQAAASMVNS
jgi:hypothetical protein